MMVEEDHYVYVKRSKESFFILSMYVDDILLAGNNIEMIVATKVWLFSKFEMKTWVKQAMCSELRSLEIIQGNSLVCLKRPILGIFLNDFRCKAANPLKLLLERMIP